MARPVDGREAIHGVVERAARVVKTVADDQRQADGMGFTSVTVSVHSSRFASTARHETRNRYGEPATYSSTSRPNRSRSSMARPSFRRELAKS
jgi:hypothetical protein